MSLVAELKRRNVFRVGIAYAVVAWLVLQVADVMIDNIGAPDWLFKAIVMVLAIGLPVVLVFAWAFELTPEGIKRDHEVDRSQSIAPQTGRRLDRTIIAVLVLALGWFAWDKFSADGTPYPTEPGTTSTAAKETSNSQASETEDRASADKAIAVLPFANRSRLEDDQFFTDGMHDDLLTQLAKISGIKVISRTSVMTYRETTKRIPEIAAELGVGKILEGGVQRAGDRIRINAQLIDVATDEHLWAETFDREMTLDNIFDIQSEITRRIVEAVRGNLTEAESAAVEERPTDSLAAYEAYLQARQWLDEPEYTPEHFQKARSWLEKAVALDPEFALAWAGLVRANGEIVWMSLDSGGDHLARAEQALARAEQYGPFLPETLAAKAEFLYRIENDFAGAAELYRRALEVRPGDADLLLGLANAERRYGRVDEAIAHDQLAIELDPLAIKLRMHLVETLMQFNEFERAEPLVNAWTERFPEEGLFRAAKAQILLSHHGDIEGARAVMHGVEPFPGFDWYQTWTQIHQAEDDLQAVRSIWTHPSLEDLRADPDTSLQLELGLAPYLYLIGDVDGARDRAQRYIRAAEDQQSLTRKSKARNLWGLSLAHALLGELEVAEALALEGWQTLVAIDDQIEGPQAQYSYAVILAMSDQTDKAIQQLQDLRDRNRGPTAWDLRFDPFLDGLRDDERFIALSTPDATEDVL